MQNAGLTDSQKAIYGLHNEDCKHLVSWVQGERRFLIHPSMQKSLQQLQADALEAGFELALVSSYRGFERQQAIFNAKACGTRPVLDDKGKALNSGSLSNNQLLYAILRWSALPGASRHHWGTDIDIYDARAMSLADVELVPSEVNGTGPCAPMHDWLRERIAQNQSYGFFRPYEHDTGGIAPERWHLSYAPESCVIERMFNQETLLALYGQNSLSLKAEIASSIDEIVNRFIKIQAKNYPDWVLEL